MGIFKKLLNDATDKVKEAFSENVKKEWHGLDLSFASKINDVELPKELFQKKTQGSNSSDKDDTPMESGQTINTEYGTIKDGVLEIKEGIKVLKEGSLSKFKSLKKVIFPASLTQLETHVFEDNAKLEELDFSKVTKLEFFPDAFVFGKSKISELRIPYGVIKVGSAVVCDIDRTHPLEVSVSSTVRKFEPFYSNHAVTFNLLTPNVDIEWLIDDAKQFYVLEKDYNIYKRQMDEYGGNVTIGVIKPRAEALYWELIDGPDEEEKKEVVEKKKQDNPSKKSGNKKNKKADEDTISFSPRVEALIKSAFRDGILTKKEKDIIIKRAIAEGEDADEFEMLLDSRIADEGIKEE